MVDPRNDTKKTLKKRKNKLRIVKKEKLFICYWYWYYFCLYFYLKIIVKVWVHIDELVYIVIYAGYIPAYIILAKDMFELLRILKMVDSLMKCF